MGFSFAADWYSYDVFLYDDGMNKDHAPVQALHKSIWGKQTEYCLLQPTVQEPV